MAVWEYIAINLSDLPSSRRAIDVLNDAGKDGWELVAITRNNISYLKRQVATPSSKARRSAPRAAAP